MKNEKYMVLYLSVKDGGVAGVYESDALGKIGSVVHALNKDEIKALPPLAAVEQIESYPIVYTRCSPRCSYYYFGGEWYKVCE